MAGDDRLSAAEALLRFMSDDDLVTTVLAERPAAGEPAADGGGVDPAGTSGGDAAAACGSGAPADQASVIRNLLAERPAPRRLAPNHIWFRGSFWPVAQLVRALDGHTSVTYRGRAMHFWNCMGERHQAPAARPAAPLSTCGRASTAWTWRES